MSTRATGSATSIAGPGPERRGAAESADSLLARLSVVVPAFNERDAIAETLSRLREACPETEILVVDDGSTDGTGRTLEGFEGVHVLTHSRNRGYGAALKTGTRRASRPFIAWYDADGQHRPEDLMAVAHPVLAGEADVVIGVRGRDSASQVDRVVGKSVLRWVARLLSGTKIPDLNSGLRCFRRDLLLRYLHLLPDGFSASTTSTILVLERGYRVAWVPIRALSRRGESTVRPLTDGLRTLSLIVRLVVLFQAFKVFTILGLALIIPGAFYGTVVALNRGEGFPTLAGTMVIAGLLTFFLGIVADQVAELRKERLEDPLD